MRQWKVTYTLYEDRTHSMGQAGMHSQKMIVTALCPSDAKAIVESMFNGLAGSTFADPL